jgi:fatty acid/phospholipid biosynthesis enzyme
MATAKMVIDMLPGVNRLSLGALMLMKVGKSLLLLDIVAN